MGEEPWCSSLPARTLGMKICDLWPCDSIWLSQVLWPCRHLRRPLHLSASCMLKGSRLEELLGWEMVGVLLVHDENGGQFVSVWVFEGLYSLFLCAFPPITMGQVVSQRFQDASRSWAQVWQQRICFFSYFSAARCVLSRRSRAALSATYSPATSLVLSMQKHALTCINH